ncbi:hypothetical protein CA236_04915 [Sphingomonas sp. ABOLG]|jgi:hypothetical protein|uniref:hypothetical protein n=1 Tax=Sphingomonas sp. ABOLG TaxID=1985880 RepID=UPI000F7E0B69|nr:hypothetical protein [Sphingomonas sp. ABOLG]RSV19371.1 hypothetical protein CA236_04915 [Sphingomonas sp. ABOLG]
MNMVGTDHDPGRDRPTAIAPNVSAGASAVIAESFAGEPSPLGLSTALELRGGSGRDRERLTFDLGFGWQEELRAAVGCGLARFAGTGEGWFALPPLLLRGPAGVGRTHVARRIADLAGLPHVGVAVGGPLGMEQLRPSGCGPDLVLPSAPVLAMAVSRCANPVVSVYGVEALDAAAQAELARMIDPETAGRWVDYACGATVDLRHVNWMIQGQEPEALTPHLQRLLRPVELRPPLGRDVPLHLAEVLAEAAVDLGVIDRVGARAEEGIAYLSRLQGASSTSRIYAAARQWLETQLG